MSESTNAVVDDAPRVRTVFDAGVRFAGTGKPVFIDGHLGQFYAGGELIRVRQPAERSLLIRRREALADERSRQ